MGGNQANIKSSLFLEIVVVLAAIILVLFYVFFSLQNREEEEKTRIENILKTVLDLENHGLESWYKDKKNHIEDVTATPTVINYTKRLIQLKQANTNLLTDPIQQEIRTYFQPILEKRNYLGIFIISPYYISLSSMRDQNLGVKNYLFDKREAQVKKAFEGETVLITPLLSDVKLKKDNTQTMFILSPIKDENGQVIAVFSFRLDPDRSLSSYTELSWYGKTSQTYAFDNQGAIITGTRLSSLNKDNANRENFNPDSVKSTTLASSLAITGDSGVNLEGYEDYFGTVIAKEEANVVRCLVMEQAVKYRFSFGNK